MATETFEIKRRWYSHLGIIKVEVEIECEATASIGVRIGLAVRAAYKSGADLSGAVLRGAVLRDADLRGAVLRGAVLRDADLSDADLRDAVLRGNLKGVPVVPNIDAAILAMVEGGEGTLDMGYWHKCETTHCRAGWAITLAGPGGAALEFAFGSAAAGALIYAASRPGKPIPNFYASNEAAMDDMRKAAAEATP